MRYYETIYIAHPNLEQEGLTKLIDETKDMLKKRGGEILYEEILGKKRLAYAIQKQRFGTYVLLQFQGDGTGNTRLNQDLELNDDILAHMIVRIDEDEVREAREEKSESSDEDASYETEEPDETEEEDEISESVAETEESTEEAAGEEQMEEGAETEDSTVDDEQSTEEVEIEPEEEK